jgi:O-antigen/teichoic acid export membrane protein
MADMASPLTFVRRLLHGGAAGDAAAAGGRQIASNILLQVGARAVTLSLSVVTVSFTARALHADGYGVWNGAGAFVGLFGILTDFGFTIAANQQMASEPERESQWLGALVGVRMTMSLIVTFLCAAAIPIFLTSAHNTHLVAWITLSPMLIGSLTAATTVFQSRLRAGLTLSFTIAQGFTWLATVATLYATHASLIWFAGAFSLLGMIVAVSEFAVTRKYATIAWRAGLELWRPLLKLALPMGVATAMITIYWQIDSVLLLQLSGPHETGIYGAAYGFLSPLLSLPVAVMSSFFPVLSAIYAHDPDRARRLVQICSNTMAVVGLPILAGSIALAGQIVGLIYGPDFAHSAAILPILMIAFVSICYGNLGGYLAPLLDLRWRLALYSGAGAALNVVLNVILIPRYGALGSAWATVVTELGTMALMLTTSLRKLKLRISVWKPIKAAALAAAMTGLMILMRPLGLFPAGILGVLFYVGGLLVLRIVDRSELAVLKKRGEPSLVGPTTVAAHEATLAVGAVDPGP